MSQACDASQQDAPSCYVCQSSGPFGRALQCGGSKTVGEERRHTYFLCRSPKCEAKFAKETLKIVQTHSSTKVMRKVEQMNKKGEYHCPQCRFDLKDIPLPQVECIEGGVEEEPPAPPPPPSIDKETQGETQDVTEPPIDLPFEECVMLVKEEEGEEKLPGAKKNTKKVKKQNNGKMQQGLVQALFFEPARAGGRQVTDEGEILEEDVPVVMQSPVGSPVAAKSPSAKPPAKNLPPLLTNAVSGTPWPEISPVSRTQDRPSWPEVAQPVPQAEVRTKQPQSREEARPELPHGWRQARDPASNDVYYWHVHTREVTWDHPGHAAASTSLSRASTASSGNAVPKASSDEQSFSTREVATRSVIEYVCIRSWKPRPEDRDCIRLAQGERVVLESETLDGWAKGVVVPEPGEEVRKGHFPRWALSENPACQPQRFSKGSRVKVIDEFASTAGGYLTITLGEELDVKHHAEPYVWCWVQDPRSSTRSGWVPESCLDVIK